MSQTEGAMEARSEGASNAEAFGALTVPRVPWARASCLADGGRGLDGGARSVPRAEGRGREGLAETSRTPHAHNAPSVHAREPTRARVSVSCNRVIRCVRRPCSGDFCSFPIDASAVGYFGRFGDC